MSAFICSNAHLNALTCAIIQSRNSSYLVGGLLKRLLEADQLRLQKLSDYELIGTVLLEENIRSFNARYKETTKAADLVYSFGPSWKLYTPVQIIKACNCYDYQSCETENYRDSQASKLIDSLKDEMIQNLPGYDKAEWEIKIA